MANNNTAPPPASEPSAASRVAVTLPLIDALLSDETYAADIKNGVGLSDEELQKLQNAAREATSELDESTAAQTRSTTGATREAEKQVRAILGDDKGNKLLTYIRQKMASVDVESLANAKPNAVPSDTRIVINAPEFRMDVWQNGQLKKTYAVGIGYPEFPLPSGLRTAKSIIVNPKWTPPDEPWVKGKFKPGKTVEAGSKDNPLGPIKIPIGLPSLIHGGKAPSRIGEFASHGCVGLTNSQIKDFAMELSALGGAQIDSAKLQELMSKKTETEEIKLAEPIRVELRYETIVVEDGKLRIFRDVYERGTNTEENLRSVLDAAGVPFDNLNPADREKILAGLKEMAIDATGDPVDTDANNVSDTKKTNASGKVTRNVKGKKEVTFELAELKGKGYPAPVNPVRP
jgi:lipoprotein-anchoring transpeptidase ErfK/SrfK